MATLERVNTQMAYMQTQLNRLHKTIEDINIRQKEAEKRIVEHEESIHSHNIGEDKKEAMMRGLYLPITKRSFSTNCNF